MSGFEDREVSELVRVKRDLPEALGLSTYETDHPARRTVGLDRLHPNGLVEEGASEDLAVVNRNISNHLADRRLLR